MPRSNVKKKRKRDLLRSRLLGEMILCFLEVKSAPSCLFMLWFLFLCIHVYDMLTTIGVREGVYILEIKVYFLLVKDLLVNKLLMIIWYNLINIFLISVLEWNGEQMQFLQFNFRCPSQDCSIGSISAWYRGCPGVKSQQGQEFFSENK